MYILKESKYTHKLRLLMIIVRKYECEWKWAKIQQTKIAVTKI